MKTKTFLVTLLPLLTLMFTGCPYDSDYSITDASAAIKEPTLQGYWVGESKGDSDEFGFLNIMSFNSNEFLAELTSINGAQIQIEKFRTFPCTIGKNKFLNVQALDGKKKFGFYRYSLSGDTLIAEPVSDKFPGNKAMKSQVELRVYIEKNMSDPKFYEDRMVFVRKKK